MTKSHIVRRRPLTDIPTPGQQPAAAPAPSDMLKGLMQQLGQIESDLEEHLLTKKTPAPPNQN